MYLDNLWNPVHFHGCTQKSRLHECFCLHKTAATHKHLDDLVAMQSISSLCTETARQSMLSALFKIKVTILSHRTINTQYIDVKLHVGLEYNVQFVVVQLTARLLFKSLDKTYTTFKK